VTAAYGPQLPTRADVDEACADWGDAMHAEDMARETTPATIRAAAHREPATAVEAWAALQRDGAGADAVRSYLAPGPEPRYDTPEARAAALADREAGS
jgi:hypothetical protein